MDTNLNDEKLSRRKLRLEIADLIIKIIAVVIAGVWAWVVFNYDKSIESSYEESFVNIESEINKVGVCGKFDAIEIQITLKNISKSKFEIIATWYQIWGNSNNFYPENHTAQYAHENDSLLDKFDKFPRHFETNVLQTKALDTGRSYLNGWLNPNQEVSTKWITYVPSGKFQSLQGYFFIVTAKDTERIKVNKWEVLPETGEIVPEIFCLNESGNWDICLEETHKGKTEVVKYLIPSNDLEASFYQDITEVFLRENQ